MKTGALVGTIYGNEWQTVYDSELGSSATSVNITGLDGNSDKEYRLICRFVSSSNSSFVIGPNGDYYNNGFQQLTGGNTTVGASRQTNDPGMYIGYSQNAGEVSMSDTIIYAKSGYVRTGLTKFFWGSGTTITQLNYHGWSWNNTADNITSLLIGGNMASGTRIILMRRSDRDASMIGKTGKINTYGKVKGCFQKIYDTTLATAATSLTISGLDGNTDIIYELIFRGVNGYSGGIAYYYRINADSGANYGFQRVYGYGTGVAADRTTATTGNAIGNCGAISDKAFSKTLFYIKSGYARTMITQESRDISGTTNGGILLHGDMWNDTSNNMTSLVIHADQTNGLGIGTHMELWAYRT